MNNNAIAKIRMMEGSIHCFIFGLLGLLPVIGLPFAFAALWYSGRIRPGEKQFWNPAKPFRVAGVASAAIGTVFWFFVISLILYSAATNGRHGGGYVVGGDE